MYYTADGKGVTPYIRLQDEDNNYLVYHGPTDPTFTGGFYNSFSWKGFSLSALVTYLCRQLHQAATHFGAAKYSDMYTLSNRMNDRWLVPGDETRTNIPSLIGVYHVENGVLNGTVHR